MITKVAAIAGGLGLGFVAMYVGMHRPGAPFQEKGATMLPHMDDNTSAAAFAGLGVGAAAIGALTAHLYFREPDPNLEA